MTEVLEPPKKKAKVEKLDLPPADEKDWDKAAAPPAFRVGARVIWWADGPEEGKLQEYAADVVRVMPDGEYAINILLEGRLQVQVAKASDVPAYLAITAF